MVEQLGAEGLGPNLILHLRSGAELRFGSHPVPHPARHPCPEEASKRAAWASLNDPRGASAQRLHVVDQRTVGSLACQAVDQSSRSPSCMAPVVFEATMRLLLAFQWVAAS